MTVNPLLARGMFYRGYIEKVGLGTGDMLDKLFGRLDEATADAAAGMLATSMRSPQ